MAEDVHVHQGPPAGGNGGGPGWFVAIVVVVLLAGVVWFAFMRGDTGPRGPDQIEVDINVPEGGRTP
jgi:GTPase involved in cell partitioning and DNA repair